MSPHELRESRDEVTNGKGSYGQGRDPMKEAFLGARVEDHEVLLSEGKMRVGCIERALEGIELGNE